MRLFNKVGIVGVGLMGGSIALGLKKKRLANEIIGISRHKKTLSLAKKIHAIDKGSKNLKIIKDADLVILATPVSAILSLAPKISKIIKKECIVTDVGSTKEEIATKLGRIFPKYIGSHPLAGSERRGVTNADSEIFRDSLCILTPTKATHKVALGKIKKLWVSLGAKVINLTASTHDKILSSTSHLPHLIAFSLIDSIPPKYLKFASTGLKDTTRIAASESELWNDIFLSNRKNLLKSIELFQNNLSRIKLAINRKDIKNLTLILRAAKAKRDSLG